MTSILPLISNSSCLCSKHWGIVPSAPTTIGIPVCHPHLPQFFSPLARFKYSSIFLFLLYRPPERQNSLDCKFFWGGAKCGILVGIKWSVYIPKSQRIVWVSFSRTNSGLYIYHLVVWSGWYLLHNFQWITSSNQSCLVLYFFWVSSRYYYEINRFISVFTSPTIAILCFNIISSYDIVWYCYKQIHFFSWCFLFLVTYRSFISNLTNLSL